MDDKKQHYIKLNEQIDEILYKAIELESKYKSELQQVNSIYKRSAQNLIHYLSLRSFDIDKIDEELRSLSLPTLSAVEGHVMRSLLELKNLLNILLDKDENIETRKSVSIKKSQKLLRKNTKLLFGYKSRKRFTRIMVTLPNTAAEDLSFVKKLIARGMNCARINCAHDEPETWRAMIENVLTASRQKNKKCRITMDLGGPKLRTGAMTPGPEVIHIRPDKDDLGKIVNPAQVWIAPPDIPPPTNAKKSAFIPLDEILYSKIKRGDRLTFKDSRGKKCRVVIDRKEGKGKWGLCPTSAYVESGTEIILHKEKQSGKLVHRVGELLPKEQFIWLKQDDQLRIHRDATPGESARYDDNGQLLEKAHISCTLPEIFEDVKIGEPIYFDDGKVEGVIQSVNRDEILVRITHAKDRGSKLKADKGINLPESKLSVSGLTAKDKRDLTFVGEYADAVNFSFVNSKEDVEELHTILDKLEAKLGIILKIETQKGFSNLPLILLTAMRSYPIGVMIARGDLAIETGWKNFASIQQEIMRICSAAHIPNVWATQVLENLAKKGTPSRAEITDAALAQQAECVMLNKGYYIHKAVKMLDRILRRMQRFQRKQQTILPRLKDADQLRLSHKPFDIKN
jgi:pyruvate kinase